MKPVCWVAVEVVVVVRVRLFELEDFEPGILKLTAFNRVGVDVISNPCTDQGIYYFHLNNVTSHTHTHRPHTRTIDTHARTHTSFYTREISYIITILPYVQLIVTCLQLSTEFKEFFWSRARWCLKYPLSW